MSRVHYNTILEDRKVEVVAGWDGPMQGYHFSIFAEGEDGEDEIIYDNLDDNNLQPCFPPNNYYFMEIAKVLKLDLPDTFWPMANLQLGNSQCYYQPEDQSWMVKKV